VHYFQTLTYPRRIRRKRAIRDYIHCNEKMDVRYIQFCKRSIGVGWGRATLDFQRRRCRLIEQVIGMDIAPGSTWGDIANIYIRWPDFRPCLSYQIRES